MAPISDVSKLDFTQTILTGLGLIAIILAVLAVITERIRRVRANDIRHKTSEQARMGCMRAESVGVVSSLLGKLTPVLEVPSIRELIEAGDRGFWTSTSLDYIPERYPETTWVLLYEAIFEQLASIREPPPDWKSNKIMGRFLRRVKSKAHQLHSSEIAQRQRHLFASHRLRSCRRELPEIYHATVGESPDPVFHKAPLKTAEVWVSDVKVCVPVSREELVALCLVTGTTLLKKGSELYYSGVGAFGMSMDLSHGESRWMLSLFNGPRIQRYLPSMGTGFTTLMAKHLACGSIPFAKSPSWIQSVYVTELVLQKIKTGGLIIDQRLYGGTSLEVLRRLPGEKDVDAFYGVSDHDGRSDRGAILNKEHSTVSTWPRVVAGVPFGGLVPQAAPRVIRAIRFTVGGTEVDQCIQNLEGLIDALHAKHIEARKQGKEANQPDIFGDNVTRRCSAVGHYFVNYTLPLHDGDQRNSAAIFSRYMNLLERIAAVVSAPDSMVTVTTSQNQSSSGLMPKPENPGANFQPLPYLFDGTVELFKELYGIAIKPPEDRTEEESRLFSENLGLTIEAITQTVREEPWRHFSMKLEDCVKIVRCILAAWATSVPGIELKLKEYREEDKLLPQEGSTEPTEDIHTIVLNDLPAVMGFC